MENVVTVNPIKKASKAVLIILVLFLMLFPFITTVNVMLIRVYEPLRFLHPIQDAIISYEARIVRVLLGFISIPVAAGNPASAVITLKGKSGGLDPVAIGWGCVGWQSMVLVGATFFSGLQGRFTRISKVEALIVGILLTFWMNTFRLTTIYYLYYHINRETALLFHDYGSVIMTIIWLFAFWFFTFTFVLRTKTDI